MNPRDKTEDLLKFVASYEKWGFEHEQELVECALTLLRHSLRLQATKDLPGE